MLTTYKDLIDGLIDYVGGANTKETERKARRAVQNAYTEMVSSHSWSYLWNRSRVMTVPQQTSGDGSSIQYTDATATVVLTGDTWPSWTSYGCIILDQFIMNVGTVLNDGVTLILDPATTLGYDLAAGSPYTLYRDAYPTPADFRTADELINLNNTGPLNFLHPREWMNSQRLRRGPSTPRIYTFMGDKKYPNAMVLKLFPAPDLLYEFDYLYQRFARPLSIIEYTTGSATLAANSTTVNGSGTNWTPNMVGSVIRFSYDSVNIPTGLGGYNPAAFESLITAVPTSTSITLTSTPTISLAGVKHSISDPADIEDVSQHILLLRTCEMQMRLQMRMKPGAEEMAEYTRAQFAAWEADARNIGRRAAGMSLGFPQRLANMPAGPDIS